MTDGLSHGTVIVTGGSGTVGSALLPRLAAAGAGRIVAVGRREPAQLRPSDSFLAADLADDADLQKACTTLQSPPSHGPALPVNGVVLAAGLDSRQGVRDITRPEWDRCLQVNAYAGLWLLATVTQAPTASVTLPVIAWSSDVVSTSQANTAVYAASKAALEEGIRHAAADLRAPGIAALLIRLPDIGVPMTTGRGSATVRSPVLDRAVTAAIDFLAATHPRGHVEVWADG